MRLSAPTNKTFFLALVLIALGIAVWVAPFGDDVDPGVAFWLVVAGGALLTWAAFSTEFELFYGRIALPND